jgi:hypothetical protein
MKLYCDYNAVQWIILHTHLKTWNTSDVFIWKGRKEIVSMKDTHGLASSENPTGAVFK